MFMQQRPPTIFHHPSISGAAHPGRHSSWGSGGGLHISWCSQVWPADVAGHQDQGGENLWDGDMACAWRLSACTLCNTHILHETRTPWQVRCRPTYEHNARRSTCVQGGAAWLTLSVHVPEPACPISVRVTVVYSEADQVFLLPTLPVPVLHTDVLAFCMTHASPAAVAPSLMLCTAEVVQPLFILACSYFQKVCRDMSNLAYYMEVRPYQHQLVVSCKGWTSSQETIVHDAGPGSDKIVQGF